MGYPKKNRVSTKRNRTPESDPVNYENKGCHSAHDEEQQQQAAAAAATAVKQHTTQQQAVIYEFMLVRLAASCSILITIDQVQVICWESTKCLLNRKRKKL